MRNKRNLKINFNNFFHDSSKDKEPVVSDLEDSDIQFLRKSKLRGSKDTSRAMVVLINQ